MPTVSAGLPAGACATAPLPLPNTSALPAVDKDGRGRVVLDEVHGRFAFEQGEPVAIERRRRVVRIEGRRSKALNDLALRYNRTFTTVTGLRVRARTPAGDERAWTRQDAQDVPLFGGSILPTDGRGLYVNVPDPATGTLVEHVSETRQRATQHFVFAEVFDALPRRAEAPDRGGHRRDGQHGAAAEEGHAAAPRRAHHWSRRHRDAHDRAAALR